MLYIHLINNEYVDVLYTVNVMVTFYDLKNISNCDIMALDYYNY